MEAAPHPPQDIVVLVYRPLFVRITITTAIIKITGKSFMNATVMESIVAVMGESKHWKAMKLEKENGLTDTNHLCHLQWRTSAGVRERWRRSTENYQPMVTLLLYEAARRVVKMALHLLLTGVEREGKQETRLSPVIATTKGWSTIRL